MPLAVDGPRIDPPVSVPRPTSRIGRRDGRARAARRPGRRARQVVRIQNLSAERAVGGAGGELGQVGLGDDDRAGRPQLLHQERIVGRHGAFEQHGAAGRRHVGGVEVVLQHDGNAVQRGSRPFAPALRIERTRGLERLRD